MSGVDSGITTVRFNDRHLVEEAEIGLIKAELQENLSKPNLRVLLDLKNVRRLSTAAVVMIFDVSRWLRNKGSTVAMAAGVAHTCEALRSLIDAYDAPGRCYLSQPQPGLAPRLADYAQLARVAEWVAVGEDP